LATQKEIASVAHVGAEEVSRWNRDPRFRELLGVAIRRGLRSSPWLRAELAAAARATRGSVRDWELYLEHGGPTSWRGPIDMRPEAGEFPMMGAAGSVPAIGQQNNFLVQRVELVSIPERASVDTLPPAMTLPARPAAQTVLPAK
jgi:hypothetical protein